MLDMARRSYPDAKPDKARDLRRFSAGADELRSRADLPPVISKVFDYWMAKRAGNPVPRRIDFDPADIPFALPHVILWDVVRPGPNFICRAAGTRVCELAGRELRGMTVEAMHWDALDKVRSEFLAVANTQDVHYVEREMQWTHRPYRQYRRLLMPLLGKTGAVDFLLGCLDLD